MKKAQCKCLATNAFLVVGLVFLYSCTTLMVKDYKVLDNGVLFSLSKGKMKVEVCSDNIIHVVVSPTDTFSTRKSLVVTKPLQEKVHFTCNATDTAIIVKTSQLTVSINKHSGALTYFDQEGKVVLKETGNQGRVLKNTKVLGESTWNIEQKFDWFNDEGLYGLGQHQDGLMNYRGHHVVLAQDNTIDVVPVLVSTRGYGIFWDNYSLTEFRDKPLSNVKTTAGSTRSGSLWSEVADKIDYYFMYGPELDNVISSYRNLTGAAPLFGKWAYGFWQCKEHYNSQKEILDVVKEFRNRQVPLDNIVQDWYYWNPDPWGSHAFDPKRYPDPSALTKELHNDLHTHIMISVWAKFDPGSNNYKEMEKNGFLYPATNVFGVSRYYDAFNEKAREMYWKQMRDSIFNKGFDAWWLDATEPEVGNLTNDSIKKSMNNALGTGARYLNAYSLMTTQAVYEGQRQAAPDKRVFILTRSNFAGQQRNAAGSWSGDISGTWDVFRKQISGGLNMCYSGLPYWTTDIGGFFVDGFPGGCKNAEYQELFTRWYQFGVFCPIFRVHGTSTPREIWNFGNKGHWAYDAQLKFDNLRYRLMPYIYSLAWKVTHEGYTMMRGLAFDFREDPQIKNIDNQFMFGPAFLVNPVTEALYHKDYFDYANMAKVIPSSILHTTNGERGLTGEYFQGENFEKKVLTRIDTSINFEWNTGSPDKLVQFDHFSVRWTGTITPSESGEYVFLSKSDDGSRLWVNNQQLVNDWTQHASEYHEGKIKLEAGKKYSIRYEYLEVIGGASVKLMWIEPRTVKTVQAKKARDDREKEKGVSLYLPQSKGWYDFWTGARVKGGQNIHTPAPIDRIPLFVKAGSIVPMGPFLQYSTEKPADPIELRVYTGANAEFTLYEDENSNYNYEKGVYATIPIKWDESAKVLTIGSRLGEFPGMLKRRTFAIVFVGENHGTGVEISTKVDKTITYNGNEIKVSK
jgi:alpha-D-xyloside xylohydrolase